MGRLKSELTWSFSRDRLFNGCRRAYFYNYYLSWGGWDAKADKLCRQAYILKNISGIDAWIGEIVHSIIKWILETKIAGISSQSNSPQAEFPGLRKDISAREAVKKAKDRLLKNWEQSRSRMWEKNVKQNLNLFEHYYGRELSREDLSKKLEKVTASINNLYESGFLDGLSGLPRESFLRVDSLDSFDLKGTKIFASPDFAVKSGDYLLYDWKTGRPNEKDTLQLSCYILYATIKWKIPPDSVKIIPAYLTQENFSLSPVEPLSMEEVIQYISESLARMQSLLIRGQENKINIKDCPKTDEEWRCKNCKFQEICK